MIWKHLWTFVIGLIFLYLQLLLVPALELFGVLPNIIIPCILYLIWTRELNPVLVVSFIIGLLYDTTQPESFGLHALIFLLMAIGTDRFRRPFEAASVLARILTLIIANLIFHLAEFLVLGVIYDFGISLFKLGLIAFIYDLAISFAIFWTMQFMSRLRLVFVHD